MQATSCLRFKLVSYIQACDKTWIGVLNCHGFYKPSRAPDEKVDFEEIASTVSRLAPTGVLQPDPTVTCSRAALRTKYLACQYTWRSTETTGGLHLHHFQLRRSSLRILRLLDGNSLSTKFSSPTQATLVHVGTGSSLCIKHVHPTKYLSNTTMRLEWTSAF